MNKLPIELIHKIFLYKIPPPHYFAYKNAPIRMITSNELNCNLSGEIKLLTDEEIDLNQEWEDFNNGLIDPMFYYQNDLPLPTPT
jgi:hypothetical protein